MNKYRAMNRPLWFVLILVAGMCLAACRGATGGVSVNATSAPQAGQATLVVQGSGPWHLTITSPADETVVAVPQVDVVGQAPADTVITINDTIVVVGATGQFSATVPLQEGPNQLDVLASDQDGHEASAKLFVTYEAPG